jgi:hypothetical protein
MTSRVARIMTLVAALIATTATGAPSALALSAGLRVTPRGAIENVTPTPLMTHPLRNVSPIGALGAALRSNRANVASNPTGSFDWSAAAIGALAACLVTVGLALSLRHRHEPNTA